MADVFSHVDAKTLLSNKHILYLGDSSEYIYQIYGYVLRSSICDIYFLDVCETALQANLFLTNENYSKTNFP